MPARQDWGDTPYSIEPEGQPSFIVTVSGRPRWALEELRRAGLEGCTPIDNPAPRWSAYVFDLRNMHIPIETIRERHYGPFAGRHARYVLRATVTPINGRAAE